MNTPHKHAELIKAWADGADIEFRWNGGRDDWRRITAPRWDQDGDYRIKPEPKPDVVDYVFVGAFHRISACQLEWARETNSNLKLTWDFETGKLKTAEVIA
jgi:hypothetical protein